MCEVLAGTLGPMTSSAVCFGKHEAWKSNANGSKRGNERGDIFSLQQQRQCLLALRDKTILAVAVGINSYLCQVGIDPFCKCPFLHCLLLICESEPSTSPSLT